jgi:chemotaxis signal transduction protein
MEKTQNLLFITYKIKQKEYELEVRCCGCREIIFPDYKIPTYIKGMIEFDGNYIPVIDPKMYFENRSSELTNLTCIIVIEHFYEYQNRQTGIIIEDIEEVQNLAAGSYRSQRPNVSTVNIRFILKVLKKVNKEKLLNDTHFSIDTREVQKQANADYIAFREIVTKNLALA